MRSDRSAYSTARLLPAKTPRAATEQLEPRLVLSAGNPFIHSVDIGPVKLAGAASFVSGTYSVTGEGSDIWNTTDQFHYDYATVTGNTTIVAEVTSVQKTSIYAKAAVMIRNGTAANAAYADVVVEAGGYVSFQWRAKAGASAAATVVSGKSAPQWVKLVRSANSFTASYSANGATWTPIGRGETIIMPAAVTTGLAVTSANNAKKCTATFSNVAVTSTQPVPPPPVQTAAITLTSPTEYQVFQRQGTTGTIRVSGIQTDGVNHDIEASFNGGAFKTIVTNVAPGPFSASLTGQAQGQGTLIVRFVDKPTVRVSVPLVGIGDVFIIAGQSNASGRALNDQVYKPSKGVTATVFGNDDLWHNLTDPIDSTVNQVDLVSDDLSSKNAFGAVQGAPAGSYWPIPATQILAHEAVPVAFIPCALGGSTISMWEPGANHEDRTTLYGSMVYRAQAVGGVRGVLWEQGETDAHNAVSQATYQASMARLAAAIHGDLGVKLIAAKLQSGGSFATQANLNIINDAIGAEWATDPNVAEGADLSGLTVDDGFAHLQSDANMAAAGELWWTAIAVSIYASG